MIGIATMYASRDFRKTRKKLKFFIRFFVFEKKLSLQLFYSFVFCGEKRRAYRARILCLDFLFIHSIILYKRVYYTLFREVIRYDEYEKRSI